MVREILSWAASEDYVYLHKENLKLVEKAAEGVLCGIRLLFNRQQYLLLTLQTS